MTAKKKLAGALGGVAVLGAPVALTAGTFSYFSDASTKNGAGGHVGFGTVKLTPLDGAANLPFDVTGAKPGDTVVDLTGETNSVCFENSGTLLSVLRMSFVPNSGNPLGFNDDVLIATNGFDPRDGLNGTHTLADAAKNSVSGVSLPTMGGGDVKCIPLTVSIKPTAGNELQGKSGGFTLKVDLVQTNDGWVDPAVGFPAPKA